MGPLSAPAGVWSQDQPFTKWIPGIKNLSLQPILPPPPQIFTIIIAVVFVSDRFEGVGTAEWNQFSLHLYLQEFWDPKLSLLGKQAKYRLTKPSQMPEI